MGGERGARAVWGLVALACFLAVLAALAAPASASSYGGSGNWSIGAAANEVDTGETITVSGNLSVAGVLTLVNTTLTLDRNATVTGTLRLQNSSLTFTVDGPGTNFLSVGPGAQIDLLDNDGSAATAGDASLLAANAFGFNSTFGANAQLNISNSRVLRAGWANTTDLRPGFSMQNGRANVSGASFIGGFEVFSLAYSGAATSPAVVVNSSFDGAVSALNVSGGGLHVFRNLRFANYTFGLRVNGSTGTTVDGVMASLPVIVAYDAPLAPPNGTAVAFEGSQNVAIANVTLLGAQGAPGPRGLTGFVVRNATGLSVRAFDGAWGESPGQLFTVANVLLDALTASNFSGPLAVINSTNVTVRNYRATGEGSGIQVAGTSGLTVAGIFADGLLVPVLTAAGVTGSFVFRDAVISNSVGGVSLGGNAAAPLFSNLTLTNVTFGVQVSIPDPTGARFDGFVVRQVVRNLLDITFGNASSVAVADWDADDIHGFAVNITGTRASYFSFIRLKFNATAVDVLRLNVTAIDNLSVSLLRANLHLGALVHVETESASDVTLLNLVSTNSSGLVALVNGGTIDRISALNITLTSGDQPPAFGPPASLVFDASGQNGAHSAGAVRAASARFVRVNVSNRGAVYVEAPLGGSLQADNLTLDSLQLDGVRVVGDGASFVVSIADVFYNGTGATGVRLQMVQSASILNLTVTAATALQLEDAWHVTATLIHHAGSYAGLLVSGGGDIQVEMLDSQGSFGVDAAGCAGLALRNLTAAAIGWAVRASYCSNVVITNLVSTASTNGVTLPGVSGASLTKLKLSVLADGLEIGPGGADVVASGVQVSTPQGSTSDLALRISYSSRVRIVGFNFTGQCEQALEVRNTDSLDLDDFHAAACGRGADLSAVRYLNLTRFFVAGAFNGSALIIANSKDIFVSQADLTDARADGFLLSGIDRAWILGVDASRAGGDGALLAFASNTTVDGLDLDGAAGACMRVLYSSRNVTVSNVSARRGLGGIEVLSSSNLTLTNIVASENGGIGVYTDLLSYDVTLRNITAALNLWNGVLVSLNGTHLIDGNFTYNGDAGIAGSPSVRLDWRIEGTASLTDEAIDLTGDLLMAPGASLTVTRSNITVEQTARRRAFQPFATIVLQNGASLTLDHGTIAPRDIRVPYSVTLQAGARLVLSAANLVGGGTLDATSSVNLTDSEVLAVDATFSGWYRPLALTGGSLDCDSCTFAQNRRGPLLVGASATLRALYSRDNDLEGLEAQGADLLTIDGASIQFNHGIGARLQDVQYLELVGIEALSNDAGGVEVLRSNVTGRGMCFNTTGGIGFRVAGADTVTLEGLCAVDNAGAGVSLEDVAQVALGWIEVTGNHGSGLQLLRVGAANVTGGAIGGNTLYGLFAIDGGVVRVEGIDFAGDEGGALRAEGAAQVSIGNASVGTTADYALTLFGTSRGTFTDLVITGALAGLLAAQSSAAFVLNSTMNAPTVVDDAVVTIGWYLRVLVQDASGYPADGVSITVWNATGATVGNVTTLGGGSTPPVPVKEREVRANGAQVTFGPELLQAAHRQLGRAVADVNVTRYTAIGMKLDNGTPTTHVTLAGEAGLSGWFLSAVNVTLRATDDRGDGVRLYWRIGSGGWGVEVGTAETVAASFSIVDEGLTRVEYYAVDAAGNAGALSFVLVRVDTTAPIARFVLLNSTEYNATLPLEWFGADGSGSGVDHFEVSYSFNGSSSVPWRPNTSQTAESFLAQDGSYKFTVVAYDASGRASEPASMALRVALLGSLRIRVVDGRGNLVSNLTIEVPSLKGPVSGSGIVVIPGIAPGNFTVRVTAPGFEPMTFEVTVTAGQLSDLGDQVMTPTPARGGLDLAFAYMALGALAVLALAYYLRMKQKWEHKRKQRETEADAQRKADRLKRRR